MIILNFPNKNYTWYSRTNLRTHLQLLTVFLYGTSDAYACIEISENLKFMLDNEIPPVKNMTQANVVIQGFIS